MVDSATSIFSYADDLLRIFCSLILVFSILFAEEDISSLFRDLSLVEEVNKEIHTTFPFHYNYTLMGGCFNTPSARMNEAGDVSLGFAYLPPYCIYAAAIQGFTRLELGINYRVYSDLLDPHIGQAGFGDFSDRVANIKLGILRRKDGFSNVPEIAIGFEDFYGSKRFYSGYIVATQGFCGALPLEVTVGYGRGRIRGLFGSISWAPFLRSSLPLLNRLMFLAEWDGIDYRNSKWEHPKGRNYSSRINFGVSTTLWDILHLNISTLRGKKIAASASINYNLGKSKGLFPKIQDPPLHKSPVNTQPIGNLRNERELAQELAFIFSEQKIILSRVYLTSDNDGKNMLWIKIINLVYRNAAELKRRIENVLASITPSNIAHVTVVIEANGLPACAYHFRTTDLRRLQSGEVGDFEFQTLTPICAPTPPPNMYEGSLLYHRPKRVWALTMHPRFLTFFGSATGKCKYGIELVGGPEGYLFDQLYYKIQGAWNIKSNISDVGDRDFFNPSQIINVRSDIAKYLRNYSFLLEQAYVQHGLHLSRAWYGRFSIGIFELAYAGAGFELLYYPIKQNWAIGIEWATLLKRSYRGLGFTTKIRKWKGTSAEYEHFIGYQYFLDLYYKVDFLKLDIKVSLGQFLARDKGARFEIGHSFASGFRFDVWYSYTNAHDRVNGERYRDIGISFAIPLDLFLTKSSKAFIPYALSVWLRDTGARAFTGRCLYHTIHGSRE